MREVNRMNIRLKASKINKTSVKINVHLEEPCSYH